MENLNKSSYGHQKSVMKGARWMKEENKSCKELENIIGGLPDGTVLKDPVTHMKCSDSNCGYEID